MKLRANKKEELIRQLGTMSDFKLAANYLVKPIEVKRLRVERGIKSVAEDIVKQHLDWKPELEAMLGTMADTVLAAKLNTSKRIINHRRNQLNIPAYTPPLLEYESVPQQNYQWSDKDDALLGTDFDTKIAEMLGIHTLQVGHRRRKLGIDAFRSSKRIEWNAEMLRNLGEISDEDFSEYFEIGKTSTFIKRILLGIPAFGKIEPPNPSRLPKEAIKLLGILPDTVLGERVGVNRRNIRVHRELRNIPPFKPKSTHAYEWTPEQDALLGTMSDKDIARKLSISNTRVTYRRNQLNIDAFCEYREFEWGAEHCKMLGSSTDLAIAQSFGISAARVAKKREQLGIEKHTGPRIWNDEEISLLGTQSDAKIAKIVGFSPTAVRLKRRSLNIEMACKMKEVKWSKRNLELLGTITDAELAYKMKIHPSSVAKKRKELGIGRIEVVHKATWRSEKNRALLGTMSDSDLGKKLGITAAAVRAKRAALGITVHVKDDGDL